MKRLNAFEISDIEEFEAEAKIGLIATINPEGAPHITLISSIRAKGRKQLMFGQFTEGLSKTYVKTNPNIGFLILNKDKEVWRGKARWTHETKHGEDYEMYNTTPMFRYNPYFGINTVHYLDLIETSGREKLPLMNVITSSILTKIAKGGVQKSKGDRVLKPWAEDLFNRLTSLKFISYIDKEGFPNIIPYI